MAEAKDYTDRKPFELFGLLTEAVTQVPPNKELIYQIIDAALSQADSCRGSATDFAIGTQYCQVATRGAESLGRLASNLQVELHNRTSYATT